MSANQFGSRFRITTFGESHGPALGVVIDGCPAGVLFDEVLLRDVLDRRKPGKALTSSRQEADHYEVLSGVYEGKTLGTPLAMIVRNHDARSEDYITIADNPRRGHADATWRNKFQHSDPRGGGRSSGRETVARVLAGAVAQMLVRTRCPEVAIQSQLLQVGPLTLEKASDWERDLETLLQQAKVEGQSYGGVIRVTLSGVPPSLGQPVFRKLKSDLAQAILSIGAVNGFELGAGFSGVESKGTDFHAPDSHPYGGIQGGISTGDPIQFKASIKPTSSILDIAKKGRHDPFIGLRAIPVMEAMTWLVLADHLLWSATDKI